MDIKNFLHQKKENKKKQVMLLSIVLFMVLLISALFFFMVQYYENITYNVWDPITVEWKVISDNNFPIYTHSISNSKRSFWLISSTVNLNNFVNKTLIINWEINELKDNKFPVLQIKNIKIPESKVIIRDNRYFFTNELISFDFSKDLDLSAEKTGRNINIYYQGEPILSMETFVCSKITSTQNCEEMVMNYTKNLNEMFTTYLWYVFYKNKEKTRVSFNDSTMGYIFKTFDNNVLLNVSHLINIINSKFIMENKQDLILNNCINEEKNIRLESISNLSKEIVDENLIKIEVEWLDTDWKLMSCGLIVAILEDRSVKTNKVSYLE
jgi:hypothetical protein